MISADNKKKAMYLLDKAIFKDIDQVLMNKFIKLYNTTDPTHVFYLGTGYTNTAPDDYRENKRLELNPTQWPTFLELVAEKAKLALEKHTVKSYLRGCLNACPEVGDLEGVLSFGLDKEVLGVGYILHTVDLKTIKTKLDAQHIKALSIIKKYKFKDYLIGE